MRTALRVALLVIVVVAVVASAAIALGWDGAAGTDFQIFVANVTAT